MEDSKLGADDDEDEEDDVLLLLLMMRGAGVVCVLKAVLLVIGETYLFVNQSIYIKQYMKSGK